MPEYDAGGIDLDADAHPTPLHPFFVPVAGIWYTQITRVSVHLSELGPLTLPPQASVSPPLDPKGEATLACGWGGGGTRFRRLDREPGAPYNLWLYVKWRLRYMMLRFVAVPHWVWNSMGSFSSRRKGCSTAIAKKREKSMLKRVYFSLPIFPD
jgi:hypothetical protein